MDQSSTFFLANKTISEARSLIQSLLDNVDEKNQSSYLLILNILSDVIESLSQTRRNSNYISEVRLLDQAITAVKKTPRSVSLTNTWEEIISLICLLLWNSTAVSKVNRKLLQLIHELEKIFPECIFKYQSKYQVKLAPCSDTALFTLWSGLICQTTAGRQLAIAQMTEVLEAVACELDVYINEFSWTVHRQHHLQSLVKLVLDLLQHVRENIGSVLNGASADTMSLMYWEKILKVLLKLLQLQDVPKDCSLLSGTAIAQLIILTINPEDCVRTLCKLYYSLNSGGFVTFGSIVLMIDPVINKAVTFGHLSLLSGILSTCDARMLTQNVAITESVQVSHEVFTDSSCKHNPATVNLKSGVENMPELEPSHHAEEMLVVWLHTQLCHMSVLSASQYQVFRLIVQFYSKLSKMFDEICGLIQTRIFERKGIIMTQVLDLLWTHLDSPVDGVSECVLDIFRSCLTLAQLEARQHLNTDGFDCLVKELLAVLLKMRWDVRGRHNLLSVLLAFTDVNSVLSTHPEILNAVPKCLATNYLTPPATHLYMSVITVLSKLPDGLQIWKETCLSMLLDSLTSSHQLVHQNAGQHLLPVTFKKLPNSAPVLQDRLEQCLQSANSCKSDRKALLHGFLAVLKTRRNCQLLKHWPVCILEEALFHPDDDIRLETFSLLCISPKKSEPLSSTEMQLIRSSLIDNMNIDEPPFRQQLQTCIKHTVVRSRDTAIAALKANQTGESSTPLEDALGYLQWLWDLCLHYLHPGSNYQRLKTCLDWINVMLDCLTVQSDRRKGGCPEQTPALLEYAQKHEMLNLYTSHSCLALLSCLLHDTDEIKQEAMHLLVRYFPWPLPLYEINHTKNMISECDLLQHALNLCNSPRARETASGATMCQLVFDKYIISEGYDFSVTNDNGRLLVQYIQKTDGETAAIQFMCRLIDVLEQSLNCAQSNILEAAKTMPSHGLMLACQQCVRMCKGHVRKTLEWQLIYKRLQSLSVTLIDKVLEVLGANLDSQDSPPSFEQMGVAIQTIVANEKSTLSSEGQHQHNGSDARSERDDTVLSAEYQMVMSWCWLNIKECSMLLSTLVESLPVGVNTQNTNTVIPYTDVETTADTLVKVLITCRHRGAIEGCNQGFLQLCVTLLSSPVQELFDIPCRLLSKILNRLQQFSHSSVTRRSAGLPLIVQSILACEAKTRQNHLLKKAITSLVAVIQEPLPSVHNQQEDLPHVHALNILKAIFLEKSLSQSVMEHITGVFILVIELLSSPFWAVRNSAMQLYGALQSRMLGQKKTSQEQLHTITAPEFFTQFPDLHPYMISKVKDAASVLSHGHLRLHPSLFPVLSILAKLSPGLSEGRAQRSLDQFQEPVESLSASPLYSVRALSASAMTALISQQMVEQHVINLASKLPGSVQECTGYNQLHGLLLQLQVLVKVYRNCQKSKELASALTNKQWLLTEQNPCFVVRSAFISLLNLLIEYHHLDPVIEKQAKDLLVSELSGSDGNKIGYTDYIMVLIQWWLTNHTLPLIEKVTTCMRQADVDIRLTCLNWLNDHKHEISQSERHLILDTLFNVLHSDTPWQETCSILQLILDIARDWNDYQSTEKCEVHQIHNREFWDYLMSVIHNEKNSQPAALSLSVSALLLKMNIREYQSNFRDLLTWSDLVKLMADPGSTESMRGNAAKALSISGLCIIEHCMHDPCHSKIITNILDACLQLVKDEQPSTRNTSATLIAQLSAHLNNTEVMPIHYNTALRKLLDIIPAILPADLSTLSWLYTHISVIDTLEDTVRHTQARIAEQFEASDLNPYEELVVYNTFFLATIKNVDWAPSPDITSWFTQEVAALHRTVQSVIPVINAMTSEILNLTYDKPIFEGIHGLLCRLQALDHLYPLTSGSSTLDQIKRDVKVINSHPHLQNSKTTNFIS